MKYHDNVKTFHLYNSTEIFQSRHHYYQGFGACSYKYLTSSSYLLIAQLQSHCTESKQLIKESQLTNKIN